jgi:hypothetical protein
MSDVTIFAVGAVIFAVTIYGTLGSLLMLGLTRLERKDSPDAATGGELDEALVEPVPTADDGS